MSFPGCCGHVLVHEWVHAIYAHCNHIISRINGKLRISRINVSPLCGISRMSYHAGILLMLLFMLSQQFSDSLFANQRFKQGMIGKHQNTFLVPPFLLFMLQFSSSPLSFLRLN
jgi:hypothetical protein